MNADIRLILFITAFFLCWALAGNGIVLLKEHWGKATVFRFLRCRFALFFIIVFPVTGITATWLYHDSPDFSNTSLLSLSRRVLPGKIQLQKKLDNFRSTLSLRKDPEVRWKNLQPGLLLRMDEVATVFRKYRGSSYTPRITSANDSRHMRGSNHYKNRAIDLATTGDGIPRTQAFDISQELKKVLGGNYKVLYGARYKHLDHIHLAYIGPSWSERETLTQLDL